MSQAVEVRGLQKAYGGVAAVRDLSLSIAAGEFFTLLGSSGSGKTTTLMAIAGFAEPDGGDILIGGRSVLRLPPERRNLGVVFQSYALFPTMDVAGNIGFPLRMRGVGRVETAARVRRALEMVRLERSASQRVGQLSGGQQQRVALARAIVFEPPVLLMDEPLGALDRQLREELQGEIRRLTRSLGITVCYVTHDQDEAMSLSDRIAVMSDATLQQVGRPAEVYERPANLFVARFLGESNVLACRPVSSGAGEGVVELGTGHRCRVAGPAGGEPAWLMVRPEDILLGAGPEGPGGSVPGRLGTVEFLGASVRLQVDTGLGPLTVRRPRQEGLDGMEPGAAIHVWWPATAVRLFDGGGVAT